MSGNPVNPARRRTLLSRCRASLCGFALLCALGCGEGPQAEFGWRPATTELILPAETAVQKVMKEKFGTPQNLVGWERLPVSYGGVPAEIAKPAGDGAFTLAIADPKLAAQIQPKQSIVWLTGAHAGEQAGDVRTFDPKTLVITLSSAPAPVEGDKLFVGFGSGMQIGRVVYMKNCMHCHGVGGDGYGPTAKYLNPRPRDFRLGIFKFTSTLSAERAARDDLHRTVSNGIPGTYMPSFLLMKDEEKTAVVEYVRWLSMRGEMEKRLDDELADFNEAGIRSDTKKAEAAYAESKEGERPANVNQALAAAKSSFATYEKEEFDGIVDETANFLAETWQKADEESSLVLPKTARVDDTAESRLRGRVLYMSNRTKCYTCHGPLGRGDGGATDDFWPKPGTNEKYAERGLHDLWGNILQPRDLTKNQYRGGRRPLDLYRRMFAGIKGTPMPAFGGTVLKDEEIWDLVNYVMSIPFDPQTPSAPKPAAMAATQHHADGE